MKVAKEWILPMRNKEYQKVLLQQQEKLSKVNFHFRKSMPKNWKRN